MGLLKKFFDTFGALRAMLVIVVLLLVPIGPFAGGEVQTTGLAVFPSVLAPTFYVIMLFVLPLDILMSFVFMSDKEGQERARFRLIIRVEIALMVLMLLSWSPFLYRLAQTAY